jgi:hypothetical protein
MNDIEKRNAEVQPRRSVHRGGWSYIVTSKDGGFDIAADVGKVNVDHLSTWVATAAEIDGAIAELGKRVNQAYGVTR